MKDSLYAARRPFVVDFSFDETVAEVFPDMIRRSVPGYADVVALTGLLAGEHALPNSRCYDLGTSLGAVALAMRRQIRQPGCTIVAIDSSEAMAERCRENAARESSGTAIEVMCADIETVPLERASVVALNFTLQFIPIERRAALLDRIHAAMLPGALLVLSEKVLSPDATEQAFLDAMHLAFKRANGYSELEISQKRAALERVLRPETIETHGSRLRRAGFDRVHVWYRCLNFASLAAFKR